MQGGTSCAIQQTFWLQQLMETCNLANDNTQKASARDNSIEGYFTPSQKSNIHFRMD